MNFDVSPGKAPQPLLHRAFTKVEVLVTIVVIGLIMGIAIPSMMWVRESGRESTARANARRIATVAASAHAMDLDFVDGSTSVREVIERIAQGREVEAEGPFHGALLSIQNLDDEQLAEVEEYLAINDGELLFDPDGRKGPIKPGHVDTFGDGKEGGKDEAEDPGSVAGGGLGWNGGGDPYSGYTRPEENPSEPASPQVPPGQSPATPVIQPVVPIFIPLPGTTIVGEGPFPFVGPFGSDEDDEEDSSDDESQDDDEEDEGDEDEEDSDDGDEDDALEKGNVPSESPLTELDSENLLENELNIRNL